MNKSLFRVDATFTPHHKTKDILQLSELLLKWNYCSLYTRLKDNVQPNTI